MTFRLLLLASTALLITGTALAQSVTLAPTQSATDDAELDEEDATVTVTGQRPRCSVVGDIPAENILTTRDIRATGATSISELLDAVSAQTGSARGRSSGRPVLLLNGLRISGFRELRDLPAEAIERMEILPEEVALKYGYSADQRVVNIVLRQRFNSTGVEGRAKTATDGGYVAGQSEATRLLIRNGQRTSLNLRVEGNGSLTEAERDIVLAVPISPDPRDSRTLIGQGRSARLTGTVNRTILGHVGATLTGEVGRSTGRSRFGLDTLAGDALVRATTSDSAAVGFALNTQQDKWRLSSTGNAELSHNVSRSDRDLTVDDRSRSNRRSFALDGTATGPLLALPAGDANATFRVGAGRTDLESRATRAGFITATDLGRTNGEASVSLDLPLAKRGSAIGRLTANANAGVTQLSDFGKLTSLGGGLNWAPATRLSLIASFTREEGAPSLQQLGDPLLETPGIRFFDATRGETVTVTTLTGGNAALDADRRRVMKLGANWQPSEKVDLRLRADYVRSSIDRPQASFPAASAALEAAFPDRFVRDGSGNLIRVDLRPVNFQASHRNTLRWGFDFTKPLKSTPPSAATIAAMRARFAPNRPPGDQPPAPGAGDTALGGQRGGFGGGGRGAGRFADGRNGGRLTLSMTHSLTLVDRVTIANGLPDLDYLDGQAVGANGGRARHEIESEAGYYNNGIGARLSTKWRSGTRVDSNVSGGDLRFSPYATVNLRLFANLGERFDLVASHPILRGTSVRFDIDNLFDARPRVRDASGAIPFSYQPGLLEPIGRTFGITLRKLFVPRRFFQSGGGRPGG